MSDQAKVREQCEAAPLGNWPSRTSLRDMRGDLDRLIAKYGEDAQYLVQVEDDTPYGVVFTQRMETPHEVSMRLLAEEDQENRRRRVYEELRKVYG